MVQKVSHYKNTDNQNTKNQKNEPRLIRTEIGCFNFWNFSQEKVSFKKHERFVGSYSDEPAQNGAT